MTPDERARLANDAQALRLLGQQMAKHAQAILTALAVADEVITRAERLAAPAEGESA